MESNPNLFPNNIEENVNMRISKPKKISNFMIREILEEPKRSQPASTPVFPENLSTIFESKQLGSLQLEDPKTSTKVESATHLSPKSDFSNLSINTVQNKFPLNFWPLVDFPQINAGNQKYFHPVSEQSVGTQMKQEFHNRELDAYIAASSFYPNTQAFPSLSVMTSPTKPHPDPKPNLLMSQVNFPLNPTPFATPLNFLPGTPEYLKSLELCGGVFSEGFENFANSRRCRRSRTVFSDAQLKGLEKNFVSTKYLTTNQRNKLAKESGLTQMQVKTWYQNRRMKWKKQLMQDGATSIPTKPKGRPKKVLEEVDENEEHE